MTGHNLIQALNRVTTVFRDKPSGLIVDYIGIGDRLRDATKKYTGAGGTGAVAFDMEEAFSLAQEMIELLREQLPESFKIQPSLASGECALRAASGRFETLPELPLQGPETQGIPHSRDANERIVKTLKTGSFLYQNWLALSNTERFKLVGLATNFLVADDELCKAFMLNEKKLSSLAPIVKSHAAINTIAVDIIFFQHVGAAVRKVKYPTTNIKKTRGQIKDLIHRSIESEEVVDVFQMAGIERFDISIINDEFLATAKEQKTGNELKLELIRQILNDEIKIRSSKNLIKSRKLKEEVEKIIADYHAHFFDSLVAMGKLRNVAKGLQEEDKLRQQLGLTEEEETFYTILANHPNAVQDFDLMKELVKKILAEVKKSASQPDWYKKDDTKAQLQLVVKKVLRFKVKADLQEILDEILEQAEERYKVWAFEVA